MKWHVIYVCILIYIYMYIYIYTHVYAYIKICTFYVHVYAYVYGHVHAYVCKDLEGLVTRLDAVVLGETAMVMSYRTAMALGHS